MGAFLGNRASYEIDLDRLIDTRALIQSNSGGGKSWAIRRILEQTAGMVQQIVLDPEGEYSTLREKYDLVVCAPHGADAAATPKTATLLARKLLETGVSAVMDIYELKAHERQEFVRRFLEALVNAPKKLWHPVLVILDEAHVYAPERGKASSTGAVIDIATRGRKRGMCLIAATQRLSKLNKDVAAELLNKMIGRTGLDVDIRRAADELGMTMRDAWEALRDLTPGEFHIYGPALTSSVTKIKVGRVITTHGRKDVVTAPPAPSSKIRKVLNELKDLPAQADEEARTIGDLKMQLRTARQRVTTLERTTGVPQAEVDRLVVEAAKGAFTQNDLNAAYQHGSQDGANSRSGQYDKFIKDLMAGLQAKIGQFQKIYEELVASLPSRVKSTYVPPLVKPAAGKQIPARPRQDLSREPVAPSGDGEMKFRAGVIRILTELAIRYPAGYTKSQLAVMSKFKPGSGTFSTYYGELRQAGFMTQEGHGRDMMFHATEAGVSYLGVDIPDTPKTHQEVMDQWRPKLRGGCFKILQTIVDAGPVGIHREDIASQVGQTLTSGTFTTYLGDIRQNGLATENNDKVWMASDLLFPEREVS